MKLAKDNTEAQNKYGDPGLLKTKIWNQKQISFSMQTTVALGKIAMQLKLTAHYNPLERYFTFERLLFT